MTYLSNQQLEKLRYLILNNADPRLVIETMYLFDQQQLIRIKKKKEQDPDDSLYFPKKRNREFLRWLEDNELNFYAKFFREILLF